MSVDKFWSDDITVLLDKNKLSHFYPTANMSMSEILNSLVRASIYLSVCLFVYKRNSNVFFIAIGTMVLTYLIYSYKPQESKKNNGNNGNNKGSVGSVGSEGSVGSVENFNNYEDSMLQPRVCVTPTVDNPFMNVALSDYTTMPNRDVCDDVLDNPIIKEQMEKSFNHGLYQDVGDVWGKNNGQRQFYTMPNTSIPNKQKDFALWLYNRGPTCKEGNGYQCFANRHHPHEKRLPLVPHEDS
jgi:hypothetical protein